MIKKFQSIAIIIFMCLGLSFIPVSASEADDVVYVAFTSDVHNSGKADRLQNWINNVTDSLNSNFDNMAVCGDLGSSSSKSSKNYWENSAAVISVIQNSDRINGAGFFICGNHEYSNGNYNETTNETISNFSDAGTYIIEDEYIIYSLGARQSSEKYSDDDISALSEFLKAHADFAGPIFIAAHYPLHCFGDESSGESSKSHDGKAAVGTGKIIEVLNNYSNVIFLWGHNHTKSSELYDSVHTENINSYSINFTYAAAGCMCDSNSILGKGLVAAIRNGSVTLTYYTESAEVVGTPANIEMPVRSFITGIEIAVPPTKTVYREGQYFDAEGMQINAVYSDGSTLDVTESCIFDADYVLSCSDKKIKISYENFTAELEITVLPGVSEIKLDKSSLCIEKGSCQSLAAQIYPLNAYDNTVIWSSDNEAVATVDDNGNVSGISVGFALVTAKSNDGHIEAVCRITVNATEEDNAVYSGTGIGFRLNSIAVADQNGNSLSQIEGRTLQLSISVSKLEECSGCTILLAKYDEDGKYIGMHTLSFDVIDTGKTIKFTFPLDNADSKINAVEAIAVPGFSDYMPLCQSVMIK